MPRPRPPHLQRQITQHHKVAWYVRIGKGPRTRIKAAFGTPEFDVEYQAALAGKSHPKKGAPAAGTLASLITRYRETTAWSALSAATRRQRENILRQVLESAGDQPFGKITTSAIVAGRERRAKKTFPGSSFSRRDARTIPLGARCWHVRTDPTAGVKNPPRKNSVGFIPWTEDDVAAYEARWPIGTRQRVWLDVLLYTGLRRGDAVRLGRQHVRDGVATLKTEKGSFTVTVTLPILPVLAATLAQGPCGDLTFIAGASGRPLTKESFGNEFQAACRLASVPGSAHGVRKIAATRAANSGATVAQLEAIFGWSGGQMASLYTRSADRKRLALEGMHMLANEERKSIPSPSDQVRAPGRKPK